MPVSETSCQDWPCQWGSSRVVGLWELLNARYRPPPAPSASVHATSRDSSDQSAAYGCMPCHAMVLPSTYELLLSSLCCLLQSQSRLSNSMRTAWIEDSIKLVEATADLRLRAPSSWLDHTLL